LGAQVPARERPREDRAYCNGQPTRGAVGSRAQPSIGLRVHHTALWLGRCLSAQSTFFFLRCRVRAQSSRAERA
jgi:hypothetical protein